MATYREFEAYVKSNYPVLKNPKNSPKGFMCVEVPCRNERSHLIFVHPGANMGKIGEFAEVVAFFGQLSEAKLEKALEETFHLPLGGLVNIHGRTALRHSIPLLNIDESEIATAILCTAMSADQLEAKFFGSDKF